MFELYEFLEWDGTGMPAVASSASQHSHPKVGCTLCRRPACKRSHDFVDTTCFPCFISEGNVDAFSCLVSWIF